jgi:hypothetical protein
MRPGPAAVVPAFVLVGAYLFVDAMNSAADGEPPPLGRPILP